VSEEDDPTYCISCSLRLLFSLILFYCPRFLGASAAKKTTSDLSAAAAARTARFELWEYSCAELFALIKVLRQSSMKNMCVSDLFASFA
jgi:hypothetical protein